MNADAACPSRYASTQGPTAGTVVACRHTGRHVVHSNLADNPTDRVMWAGGSDGELTAVTADLSPAAHPTTEDHMTTQPADVRPTLLDVIAAAIRSADSGIERGTRPIASAISAALDGISVQWHPATINEVINEVDGWDEIGAAELAHHVMVGLGRRAAGDAAPRTTHPLPIHGCGHTTAQHHHMAGDNADTRSTERAIRELTAERDAARREVRSVTDQLTHTANQLAATRRALNVAHTERDAALARLDLDAWNRLTAERDQARADTHHDIARQLDTLASDPGILRDWLTTCNPTPTSFGELLHALAEKLRRDDTTPPPSPGSPADRAQDTAPPAETAAETTAHPAEGHREGDTATEPSAPRWDPSENCYCGGPNELPYPHRHGTGYYCRAEQAEG